MAIERVAIVGAGTIGSLLVGHLGTVCDVAVLTRRPEHAAALVENGLRISGKHELVVQVHATTDPSELGDFDVGIFASKALDLEASAARLAGLAPGATMMCVQNGLGAEAVVARHGDWPIISAVTFMSGIRHADWHVEYELDTATWMGPWAQTATPYAIVEELASLMISAGLEAEPMPDLLPAQWSKLIFNSAINSVAAVTGLPHVALFAQEAEPGDLGHLVHGLIDEGVAVASAAGIALHDDPWAMNVLAVQRGETGHSDYAHRPSMLEDVLAQRPTEVEFITGALVAEAARLGVPAPLSTALYQLVRGREASWAFASAGHRVAVGS
ncbi:MAG: ketopantoate reductase family protein [Solirubrobacteraceae bacterium]